MKKQLEITNDALTYILEGMYNAERNIQTLHDDLAPFFASDGLKSQVLHYCQNSIENRVKLKRIFGYLLAGPFDREASGIILLVTEMRRISSVSQSRALQDILINTSFRSLTCFKISEYSAARDLAMQIDLQSVVDLLDNIIAREEEQWSSFVHIALTEVNQNANTWDVK